ncbi:MAG TPA: CehA/McbA family metallohydrolase [Gemmataceae bacterium]|jgi:hypothetical protein|nr:CehA/McbA family metallohydrolase [Gemmataceae bacterium]
MFERRGLGAFLFIVFAAWLWAAVPSPAQTLEIVDVDGQPLGANVQRIVQSLEFLGAPLPKQVTDALQKAADARDSGKLQALLDPLVVMQVSISPEDRVKVKRGAGSTRLQQGGFVPVLIKVVNESTSKKPLAISSPQAGLVFGGGGAKEKVGDKNRFLKAEMYQAAPMTANLSGLKAEYAIALLYSSEPGSREATIAFNIGQGTQDLGFRGEVPILFEVHPAIPVQLAIHDFDGKPTVARLTITDKAGRVYPPQAKRLAPDLFFQQQVYRPDGGQVLLPPGEFKIVYGRGPEYRQLEKQITVPERGAASLDLKLDRWVNPMDYGFYSGDHHIHAAGCAHYTNPTEGVFAQDMFLHVKGEGLNVGCNLTWGPCYEFQRQFFEPVANKLSEPLTVLKYDIEISGFGSQALGHVCLLNLRDQTYPGSEGTKTKGWPTWTTPAMRWAKQQGGVTGYAHSANGLEIRPVNAAKRLLEALDADKNGVLSKEECANALLPDDFAKLDQDGDGNLSEYELRRGIEAAQARLPNYAIPEMNGIGAQEICVTTAQGLCDFISAMDTNRIPEWNCWYHLMNCGFPLKVSGETDFPCISGGRVGQGRVYVQLGKVDRIDFSTWCQGIAKGQSYVSDGYAHALEFTVDGKAPGTEPVQLATSGKVKVQAKVAFASTMPLGTSIGSGRAPLNKTRTVSLIQNGVEVAKQEVPADDQAHDIAFEVPVESSSWLALRQFPQMHTNPVNVLVSGKPIRASRRSAQWCIGVIEQLWKVRGPGIAEDERKEAEATFQKALATYRKIEAESTPGS